MVDRAIIWYLGYNMMRASWRVSATKRDVLYRVKRGRAGYVSYLTACEMNQSFSGGLSSAVWINPPESQRLSNMPDVTVGRDAEPGARTSRSCLTTAGTVAAKRR
jgi:hypothetical protein